MKRSIIKIVLLCICLFNLGFIIAVYYYNHRIREMVEREAQKRELLLRDTSAAQQPAAPDNAPLAMQYLEKVEQLIRKAEQQHKPGFGNAQPLEEATLIRIDEYIEGIREPRQLYTMAIALYEGYEDEFRETLRDRLLFMSREIVVHRLSRLGTEEARVYFRRLHEHYGQDGAASTMYRELNQNFNDLED